MKTRRLPWSASGLLVLAACCCGACSSADEDCPRCQQTDAATGGKTSTSTPKGGKTGAGGSPTSSGGATETGGATESGGAATVGGTANVGGAVSVGGTSSGSAGSAGSFAGSAGSPDTFDWPEPCTIVAGDVAVTLVEQGASLVDVREVSEYEGGALPGAVNLPLSTFPDAMSTLSSTTPVVVYCASGSRSSSAASQLCEAGFQVYDLGSRANWPK
jgi:rhodanese-related sulfurtransferase